jgi:ribonuclease P protein component
MPRGYFIFVPTMAKQFTLGKEERLKSRKAIEQLFKEGKSFVMGPLKVYYQLSDSLSPGIHTKFPVQAGTGVSVKHFKKAVDRNRVKRIVRETWRLQKEKLKPVLQDMKKQLGVFIIYNHKELPVYKDIFPVTGKAIEKLHSIISKSV